MTDKAHPELPLADYWGSQASPEDLPLYTADQMRAYADATEALRHPSDRAIYESIAARYSESDRASRNAAGSGISDASVQALGMALAKQHAVYLTTGSVRKLLEDALAMAPATTQAQEATHWIRVVDEELVGAHLGVADASDDYNTAKAKLNKLIAWHVAVATDPDVNGGLSLQPVAAAPTQADSAPGDEAQVLADAERWRTLLTMRKDLVAGIVQRHELADRYKPGPWTLQEEVDAVRAARAAMGGAKS